MIWLQKGDFFLVDVSKAELSALYKKEKNVKGKLRLLAAIQRKDGKTLDEIASSLQKPKTTIHDWLQRIERRHLENLHDVKQSGRPSKLNTEEKTKLIKILSEKPEKMGIPFVIWTTSLVQYIIHRSFNIHYKFRNVEYLINKLGFSLQKPRPENKKANKKLQEKFKVELKKKFNITLNLDSRSFVLTRRTLS